MSYYDVIFYDITYPVTKILKDKGITFFGGDDNECHLNIPDDQFVYHLTILKTHFDVAFTERHGKTYVWLDYKYKMFRRRG